MSHFAQAIDYEMKMPAKIQCLNMHRYLYIISLRFEFLKISIKQYCTNKDLVKPLHRSTQ
jgi:hypothetical protein